MLGLIVYRPTTWWNTSITDGIKSQHIKHINLTTGRQGASPGSFRYHWRCWTVSDDRRHAACPRWCDCTHTHNTASSLTTLQTAMKTKSSRYSEFNPLTPTVAIWGTTIKHPVPDRVKLSFVMFEIWALWRWGLSVRVPGCQILQMTASPATAAVESVYRLSPTNSSVIHTSITSSAQSRLTV